MGNGKGRPGAAAALVASSPVGRAIFEALAERSFGAPVELDTDVTGVEGLILIAPASGGRDGPHVRWQREGGRLRAHLAVSIGDKPAVLDGGLKPANAARVTPELLAWTKLNRAALLAFWNDSASWSARRVARWRAGLKPVAGRRAGRA